MLFHHNNTKLKLNLALTFWISLYIQCILAKKKNYIFYLKFTFNKKNICPPINKYFLCHVV